MGRAQKLPPLRDIEIKPVYYYDSSETLGGVKLVEQGPQKKKKEKVLEWTLWWSSQALACMCMYVACMFVPSPQQPTRWH